MWAEEPLCRSMRRETEVYRFTWRSSFDGDAVVRIGRQDDEITLRWAYGRFRPSEVDDAPGLAALTLSPPFARSINCVCCGLGSFARASNSAPLSSAVPAKAMTLGIDPRATSRRTV
jgi:hypothetical protein